MDIDLKIAEALGIPILGDHKTGEEYLEYYQFHDAWYYCPGNYKESFKWSLDGPDAGNTEKVMRELFNDNGFDVHIETWPGEKSFVGLDKDGKTWEAEGFVFVDAFRKVASKALGVSCGR